MRTNQTVCAVQIRATGSHGASCGASEVIGFVILEDFSDFCMQNRLGITKAE